MTDPRRQHAQALLATHMAETGIQPEGVPPTEEELALLLEGELAATRRRQILTHLTSNPALYQQWLSLTELYEKPQKATQPSNSLLGVLSNGLNNWLIDWRYAGAGLAGIAAVIMLLVMVQPALEGPRDEAARQPPSEPPVIAEREQARQQAARYREDSATVIPAAPGEECLPLTAPPYPETVPGLLCLRPAGSGERSETRWYWLAETEQSTPELLLRDQGTGAQAMLSENQHWLAYRLRLGGSEQLHIVATASLFADEIESGRHFDQAGEITYVWRKNQLLLESPAPLVGDDVPHSGDEPLRYRYDPLEDRLERQP